MIVISFKHLEITKIMFRRANKWPTSNTRCREMWDPPTVDEIMLRVMVMTLSKMVGSNSRFSNRSSILSNDNDGSEWALYTHNCH